MNMMTELKDVRNGHVLREKMRIAGERVGGGRAVDVRNPYTGALVGTVPKATVDEVRRAFAIAGPAAPRARRASGAGRRARRGRAGPGSSR